MMFGEMITRSSGQSWNSLLQRTALPLRCKEGQEGPTSCSALLKPLAPIFIPESQRQTHSKAKALVLSLKQYHAHYYRFYEKGTTRAMVGLQGLHMGDAFWCSNISAGVKLKSFSPWCFKLGGNTDTISVHLREVHYCLAFACDLCYLFTSMSVQVVLEHHSRCMVRSHKKKSKG